MKTPENLSNYWLPWICLGVLAAATAIIWFTTISPTPPRVVISLDANGSPSLLGVSLANTNLRDGAFQAMGAAGLKVATRMPPGYSYTNQSQVSNLIKTFEAMNQAGLFTTNSAPNPYE